MKKSKILLRNRLILFLIISRTGCKVSMVQTKVNVELKFALAKYQQYKLKIALGMTCMCVFQGCNFTKNKLFQKYFMKSVGYKHIQKKVLKHFQPLLMNTQIFMNMQLLMNIQICIWVSILVFTTGKAAVTA